MTPRSMRMVGPNTPRVFMPVLALAAALLLPVAARAQQLDLSHGGPITVTSTDGIDWHQNDQTIIARGNAKAVRDTVTVTADVLIAHYRRKACTAPPAGPTAASAASTGGKPAPTPAPVATKAAALSGPTPACPPGQVPVPPPAPKSTASSAPPGAPPGSAAGSPPGLPGDSDTGNNEIYRLEAIGHVHIYTATDQAWGDHAVYDIDQSVLVLTGGNLRLVTPQDTMTARDSMEYWSQQHMAVGRGNAVVVTNDGRRVAADVLVGYTTPGAQPGQPATPSPKPAAPKPGGTADPLAASGKLQRVDAFGNVEVRTATEIVRGDRGVYVPDTGIARIADNVRITRGQNQLNGNQAEVDLRTGISRLIANPGRRVQGLVVPNSTDNGPAGGTPSTKPTAPPKAAVNRPIGGRS